MASHRIALPSAIAVALLTLAGCGSAEVSTEELETVVTEQMTQIAGQAPDRVECPDPLPAEEGSEIRCTLYAGEDRLGITVTSKGPDGDEVKMDIQADDELME